MALKYIQLTESLRREIIRRGPLGEQKLPTEADLMRAYGVSRQTVRQALSVLQNEGMIVKRQGSGTYIAPGLFPSAFSSHDIAILLPDTAGYRSPYEIGDVQTLLNEAGYSASIYSTENRAALERELLLRFLDKPVRGLLVRSVRTGFPNPNLSLYQELAARGTAIVSVGESRPDLSDSPALWVTSDDFGGGALLADHLLSLGHKKIAGIFRLDNQSGADRYAGVLHALCENGLGFDDRNFLWYDPLHVRMPESKVLLSFIRTQLTGCTAVICQDESIAAALIQELQRLGIPVPQRISVAAFASGTEASRQARITCAVHPNRKPWLLAADLLLAKIAGKPVSSVSFPWALQTGDTTEAVSEIPLPVR
ncbi:MAG: substrate-binding domain-containing protein [Lachnospiraceae bacterium]|nr:substrate-binding domain-containing protein [Lachnospiraceae bacterium]MCD7764972.1 substrate-binding domain-containing protein [Lachnospiraceae bacterium]